MQPNAEAVIIGGGVIGTSILYHLTQLGMTNAVLLERDILCSGSSGKSAALVRQHYSNEVTIRITQKSVVQARRRKGISEVALSIPS